MPCVPDLSRSHGVEQAFMPAFQVANPVALAYEVSAVPCHARVEQAFMPA